jgi:hypothetical protein
MSDRRKRPHPDDQARPEEDVVLLQDLAPRDDDDVKGGARKIRFGEPQPPLKSLRKRAP